MQSLGLKVDSERRRLWALSNKNIDGKRYSAVHIINIDTKNVDGMVLYKNSLICNRWAGENKDIIIRYFLDKNGREIIGSEIIDYKNQLFKDPTTNVIVDNYLYSLVRTSLGVFVGQKMDEVELLKNPLVLKYKLD